MEGLDTRDRLDRSERVPDGRFDRRYWYSVGIRAEKRSDRPGFGDVVRPG